MDGNDFDICHFISDYIDNVPLTIYDEDNINIKKIYGDSLNSFSIYNDRELLLRIHNLLKEAKIARERAYTPYSHFKVGAALLCADGTVYQGCNIENASYSPTNCAERTAFFHAIYDGHRDFTAIAICGGMGGKITNLCSPCGVCRQVMTEFCGPDFQIHLTDSTGAITTCTLAQLMPLSFSGAEHLL